MLDLSRIEAALKRGPLVICRQGPESWSGGMASPEETFRRAHDVDVTPLELIAEIHRLRGLLATAE